MCIRDRSVPAICHLNLFLVFDGSFKFHDNYEMFGAAASSGSGGLPAAPVASGRAKIEARLSSALMHAEVQEATLDKLGDAGLCTVRMYANIADGVDAFRKVLEQPEIDIKGNNLAGLTEQANLVSVWKSLRTTADVEEKAQAERIQMALPPSIQTKDVKILTKLFEKTTEGYEVTKYVCPSRDYFARKVGEIETCFEAEHLTQVTTTDTEDVTTGSNPELAGYDLVAKVFKTSHKEVRVSMPRTPESLRARLKTMGLCFTFLKLKFPGKEVLRTATIQLFSHYTDWLFGPHVWGKAQLGLDGKPIATPTIDHVMMYDNAIRARVADAMNSGTDIRAAFAEATGHEDTHQTHFFGNVSIEYAMGRKSITAPGLASDKPVVDVPTGSKPTQMERGNFFSTVRRSSFAWSPLTFEEGLPPNAT